MAINFRKDLKTCFTYIVSGFVSQTPLPDLYTDIYVNRPQLTNQPSCTTYNELMVELGFAKKSEESTAVRRTQPSYYTQALHQRIKMLSTLCRDKDLEIAKLCGDQPPDTPARSPFHDIRYLLLSPSAGKQIGLNLTR